MTDRARVFPEAQTVLRMLLQDLDQRAPGFFPDVYIVGSLALDDARPGKSDIDLVLVCPESVTNDETMAALTPAIEMIRAMYPDPALDGIVLSPRDLALGSAMIEGPRPVIFEGQVNLEGDGSARNPVTWQVLRQGGITWRGRHLPDIHLHRDPDLLRAWTRGNLESYWRPWLAKSRSLMSKGGLWSLRDDFVEWGVLGVTRLLYTLATGEIVSKTGAGQYALETFPEYWHKIVREAMDIRTNPERSASSYRRDVLGRRKEARDYVAMVIEDALGM
jgi:hypothetical protein